VNLMSEQNQQPNVLFIMADQWRGDWLGAVGADFLRTPNIDRLAAQGVTMRRCYSNTPVCAPARIGLTTGLQPVRLGALSNHAFLPTRVPTIYQRFRDQGYKVGCVGKLDLAKPDDYNGPGGDRPCVFGWGFTHPEECEGKMHAGRGTPERPLGPYGEFLRQRGLLQRFHDDYERRKKAGFVGASEDSVLPTDAFEDVYIGRRAAEWIEQQRGDFPWHYVVSFVGPHNPFDPPREYADRWRHADIPPATPGRASGKPPWVMERDRHISDEHTMIARRQYAAAIEVIDDMIGEILNALERSGQAENTYIVFVSDHGEMLGDHGIWTKLVPYEPSVHVPCVVAGPGIEAGRTSGALAELIDVGATVCDLAGIGVMDDVDATSFAPLLRGDTEEHREDVLAVADPYKMLRTERYKLIQSADEIHTELYDLVEDPLEQHNIAADEPELTEALWRRYLTRLLAGKWTRG
jgi:choline-sulfatase